jgi:CRP-like cAMP-binding protein
VKASGIERSYSAGQRILARGSAERELYVIRSGEVRLEGPDDRSLLLGAGDVFGEVAAILGEPHLMGAVAESDVALLAIDLPLLNRLCAEDREFPLRLISHLAQRLSTADGAPRERQGEAAPSLAQARLARVILRRAGSETGRSTVKGKLKDLAEDADLPIREAYAVVQDLLEKRIVRLSEDHLTLLEPERLREATG